MELREVYEILGRTYALLMSNSEREDKLQEELEKVKEERDALKTQLSYFKNNGCCCGKHENSENGDDF